MNKYRELFEKETGNNALTLSPKHTGSYLTPKVFHSKYTIYLESKLEQAEKENKRLSEMCEKFNLEKFAQWMVKNNYCDTDILDEGGVYEYLKKIES